MCVFLGEKVAHLPTVFVILKKILLYYKTKIIRKT